MISILSIETSAGVASAAVTVGDKLVCEVTVNNKKTHSQTLMPIIDKVLSQSEMTLEDVDVVAVADGPGSFTGLRIGISTAKGLAHALGKPIVGVSSLMSMAYNMPFCEYIISPIMDARRSQVYNAVYEWKNGAIEEIVSPRAISVEELCSELLKYGKKTVFPGDGAPVYRDMIISMMGDKAVFAPSCANMQRASALAVPAARLFEEGKTMTCYELKPVYLRKSQAEREAEEKEKQQTVKETAQK